MPEPTSVEVWAPAFERSKTLPEPLTSAAVFSGAEDWRVPGSRWCNLCESWVSYSQVDRHVRDHERERREWRRRSKRSRDREAVANLKQANRLKRENERVLGDRASGDGADETPSPDGRPSRSARTERSMANHNNKVAATAEAPKKEKEAGPTGADLFKSLLDRVKAEKVGAKIIVHPDSVYARVLIDEKRNAGYIVAGRTKLNVYPQALAKDMPKDVGFRKVELGSHHYGRGEVIVPVESESDFGTAINALKAAAKLPAPERKKKAEPKKAAAKVGGSKTAAKKS